MMTRVLSKIIFLTLPNVATSLTRKEPRGSDNNPEVDDWPNTEAPCRIDVTDVSALEGNTLRRDVPARFAANQDESLEGLVRAGMVTCPSIDGIDQRGNLGQLHSCTVDGIRCSPISRECRENRLPVRAQLYQPKLAQPSRYVEATSSGAAQLSRRSRARKQR